MKTRRVSLLLMLLFMCSVLADETAHLPVNWQELPPPYHSPSASNPPRLIARPDDAVLTVPAGFVVREYLSGFLSPRFMLLGSKGEILLSDMEAGVVYMIKARKATPIVTDLDRPYGMAFYQDWLYVADARAVYRYRYVAAQGVVGKGEKVIPLSRYASGHITRSILFDEAAGKLYLSVGSRSNVDAGEPPVRAAVSRYDPNGDGFELFATGIRNAVGLQWYPGSDVLWVTSHERDGLGDDLVPDYFTAIAAGEFYGWPYAYIGPHEDPRHAGAAPDLVARTVYPDVLLGSHVGAMDFMFYTGTQFPERYHGGAFIALHGSWNRAKRSGYKIAFVPFADGQPLAGTEDFLSGWMIHEDRKEVWGRPVAVLQLPDGSLLISDDGGGKLWQVSYQP